MAHRPQKSRNVMPSFLAALSCAIALLAAQPASAQLHAKRTPIIAVAHPLAPSTARGESIAENSSPKTTPALQAVSFFNSARSLHILATVEILKRLLITELTPVSHPFCCAILFAEPLCLGVVADPTDQPAKSWEHFHVSLQDCQFAIEHHLLAPPLV